MEQSSGASTIHPVQTSALRKGGFVVINDHPCKVVDMTLSKTGKHGSAKAHIVGIDIFTGNKYEMLSPSTQNVMVPDVQRDDYVLLDILDDNFVSLLRQDHTVKEDLKLPEGELGEQIRNLFSNNKDSQYYVTVQAAMNKEQIMSIQTSNR